MEPDLDWPDAARCDVSDTGALTCLHALLKPMKLMLSGDDEVTIESVLIRMAWDAAVFRTLNYTLGLNERSPDARDLPASLIELYFNRFGPSQMVLLRRLFEYPPSHPSRAVYSIPTLLQRVKEARPLLTRQNYVAYDGTTYDPDAATDHRQELIARCRHRVFDTLTDSASRDRFDRIAPDLLKQLEKGFVSIDRISRYTNNFIAHSASPGTRKNVPPAPTWRE
jgi:hypothetical protein